MFDNPSRITRIDAAVYSRALCKHFPHDLTMGHTFMCMERLTADMRRNGYEFNPPWPHGGAREHVKSTT